MDTAPKCPICGKDTFRKGWHCVECLEATMKSMTPEDWRREIKSMVDDVLDPPTKRNHERQRCNSNSLLLHAAISNAPRSAQGPLWASYWEVINGVSLAKSLGYVPEGKFPTARRLITREDFHASLDETPDGLVADLIEATLTSSIKAAYDGSIDYNDQIYMPALFGGTFPRFPLTMVDEYQDLNLNKPCSDAATEALPQSHYWSGGRSKNDRTPTLHACRCGSRPQRMGS